MVVLNVGEPRAELQLVHSGGCNAGNEADPAGETIADAQDAGEDAIELAVGQAERIGAIRTTQVDHCPLSWPTNVATALPAFTVAPLARSMLSAKSNTPSVPVTLAPAPSCSAKSAAPKEPASSNTKPVPALTSAAAPVLATVRAPFPVRMSMSPLLVEMPLTPPTLVSVRSSTSSNTKKFPVPVTFAARVTSLVLRVRSTDPVTLRL